VALGTQMPEAARAVRSVRVAVIALVVLAAIVVGLFVTGQLGDASVAPGDLSSVLLVGAGVDEDGGVVAQVVTIADVSGATTTLEPVSPARAVTIPGTTYDTLADAYPFGGGAGVAEALARSQGTDPLPYVALNGDAFAAALEQEGRVTLELPAPMSVFDGEDLFTLSSGAQSLTPAEVGAVFKGAPYLTADERAELDGALAVMIARLVATTSYDAVSTDLSEEAYSELQAALATAR